MRASKRHSVDDTPFSIVSSNPLRAHVRALALALAHHLLCLDRERWAEMKLSGRDLHRQWPGGSLCRRDRTEALRRRQARCSDAPSAVCVCVCVCVCV